MDIPDNLDSAVSGAKILAYNASKAKARLSDSLFFRLPWGLFRDILCALLLDKVN